MAIFSTGFFVVVIFELECSSLQYVSFSAKLNCAFWLLAINYRQRAQTLPQFIKQKTFPPPLPTIHKTLRIILRQQPFILRGGNICNGFEGKFRNLKYLFICDLLLTFDFSTLNFKVFCKSQRQGKIKVKI